MDNPFSKLVKGVRVIVMKYDPNSVDGKHFKKLGIPVACGDCGDFYDERNPDNVELVEILMIVEQKILLPDNIISNEYLEHPVVAFYCKHCMETKFGNRSAENLPMFQ